MMPEFLRAIAHAARALVWRRKADRDLDDELRFHVEMETEQNRRRGMSPPEARRAALLAFGGVQRYREQYRAERGSRGVERLVQDVRHAARRLVREGSFSVPTVAALGVGIGATVAVFVLADAVLRRPLPYPNADRLVVVGQSIPSDGALEGGQSEMTYLHYLASNRSFDAFGIYYDRDLSLTDGDQAERVIAARVTHGVFEALGVSPILGTWCQAPRPGQPPPSGPMTVVISHSLWTSRYARDPGIVGRRIAVNRGESIIAGVMPPGFHFPRLETQLWHCMRITPTDAETSMHQTGIALLRKGVSTTDAEADLARLMATIGEAFPAAARAMARAGQPRPVVTPLRDVIIRDVRSALILLTCTAAIVLLIAWANSVNLVLVRSERQRRQIAVARALGATTGDVLQRHLCEAVLLALGAGVIAWMIAALAINSQFGFPAGEIPRLHELRADATTVLLTAGLAAITVVLLGGAAFARTHGTTVLAALRSGAGRARSGPEWRRMQRTLVVLQVALALTLLITAGVVVQSYWRLSRFDLGFDPRSVLTIEVPLPFSAYRGYERSARFHDETLARIRELPGVVSAETADGRIPLMTRVGGGYTPVAQGERPDGEKTAELPAAISLASPGWFEAMRIPIRHGRTYRPGDLVSESHPVVVSAALARGVFGVENAVGRRLSFGRPGNLEEYTIVGVVGDVPGDRIPDGPARTVYFPVLRDLAATPDSAAPVPIYPSEMTLFIRTSVDPAALVAPIRRVVAELDPQVPATDPRTLEDVVRGSMARARLTMLLLLAGSAVALLLGVIGIYGVVSYSVSQRTPEIGIRMALGATPSSVNAMVLREGVSMTAIGVAGGIAAALFATKLLRGLLFGVSAVEPVTFTLMIVLLFLIAVAASYIPARRAAQIDPVRALRAE